MPNLKLISAPRIGKGLWILSKIHWIDEYNSMRMRYASLVNNDSCRFGTSVWSSSESNAVMADIDPGINFMIFHSFVLPQLHFYLKHIS
ncbi:hypothetical protein EPI10_022949 [Gossypium australe]|uniref:Uncharacterized protein n=1 Tax=Gossypium australe TaxID=47621 RepID=A0A5B6VTI9_9ROSI|nr:hypothetical protein EPI10_022949 [Gossypium australe]